MARIRLGELLLNGGHIDSMQLDSALAHQRQWGGRIGQAIVQLGFLTEERMLQAVGRQLGVPFVVIGDRTVPPSVVALMPRKLIRTRRAFPLEKLAENRRGPLVVAFADPADLIAMDEISFVTGLEVRAVLAAEWDIDQVITRHLGDAPGAGLADGNGRPREIELPPDTSPLSGAKKGFFH
jgi:type IV pilus assembly protein PilB